ncbi:hypothetical protein AMK19_12875 [Kitasatospora sp. CB01950]|nr:hypothetical protein AMK19_12875 [Kitasatospora sp. CB01950]
MPPAPLLARNATQYDPAGSTAGTPAAMVSGTDFRPVAAHAALWSAPVASSDPSAPYRPTWFWPAVSPAPAPVTATSAAETVCGVRSSTRTSWSVPVAGTPVLPIADGSNDQVSSPWSAGCGVGSSSGVTVPALAKDSWSGPLRSPSAGLRTVALFW